jgi:hypothetical protein
MHTDSFATENTEHTENVIASESRKALRRNQSIIAERNERIRKKEPCQARYLP